MAEKKWIPKDLERRYTLLKAWVAAGKHPRTQVNTFEFAKEVVNLIERVALLDSWKTEQLEVESGWNPQDVGRELGMKVGDAIRPNILPSIKALNARLTALDWHPITPENPPQPHLHEVWGLHVGIKIVTHPVIGEGYTHMRLLNVPTPKKEGV